MEQNGTEGTIVPGSVSGSSAGSPPPAQPDNTAPVQPAAEGRPEWLPEKFASVEQLLDAYKQLSSKTDAPDSGSESKAPDQETQPQQKQEGTEQQNGADSVDFERQVIEAAGLQYDAVANEIAQSGTLSDATYESLAKAGYPRSLVDGYMRGQQALYEQYNDTILREVGVSRDDYARLTEWAKASLPAKDLEAYDAAILSGDVAKAVFALKGLKGAFDAKQGSPPAKRAEGANGGAGPADVYANRDQYLADVGKPEYATSEDFRAKVAAKITRSRAANPNFFNS
jgi:hypothetical protein